MVHVSILSLILVRYSVDQHWREIDLSDIFVQRRKIWVVFDTTP